jgi:hypothetical protein
MGPDIIVGIFASIITTVSGLGWVLDRNGRKIDSRFETVISHMQKVEKVLNDMRAELPLQYTLREDHFRLSERVDRIEKDLIITKQRGGSNDL